MRSAKLLFGLLLLALPGAALAQQPPAKWTAGAGVGLVSHGGIKVDTGDGPPVEIKGLDGETFSVNLDRPVVQRKGWSLRAGAELSYSSARTGSVMDGDLDVGSARLDRWSGFALVTAHRDLGLIEPYVGVGAGVVSDKLVLRRTGYETYTDKDLAPAAKVVLGMDVDTKPMAFGVSLGVTDTFDRKSSARFGR